MRSAIHMRSRFEITFNVITLRIKCCYHTCCAPVHVFNFDFWNFSIFNDLQRMIIINPVTPVQWSPSFKSTVTPSCGSIIILYAHNSFHFRKSCNIVVMFVLDYSKNSTHAHSCNTNYDNTNPVFDTQSSNRARQNKYWKISEWFLHRLLLFLDLSYHAHVLSKIIQWKLATLLKWRLSKLIK